MTNSRQHVFTMKMYIDLCRLKKNDYNVNFKKLDFYTLMIPVYKAQSLQLGHYCQVDG